jgi:glycosyltransferase involved in cell wall biosynthesis
MGARQALGISGDARVLLVFGVQAVKRKHIDTLLQATTGFTPKNKLLLLFVGASLGHEPHPFSGWQGTEVEVRIEEGFISEERVELYFAAADAVWANYRDFPGASGALLQAMGFGRLALSSNEGEIGSLCRTHNLGPLVASSSVAHLRVALDQFVALSKVSQAEWEMQIATTAKRYAWPQTARQILSRLGFSLPTPDDGAYGNKSFDSPP